MSLPILKVRSAIPPHETLVTTVAASTRYGFMSSRPNTAEFSIPMTAPNTDAIQAQAFEIGAMISIERTDGVLPWVGFIETSDALAGASAVKFTAKDHIGALFARGRTPKTWRERETSSGTHIKEILAEAESRAEPPLMVRVDIADGGPSVSYQPEAEGLHDFLKTMASMTGWEWGLRHTVGPEVVTTLVWAGMIGTDRHNTIVWEEGRHFAKARLRRSAEGYVGTAIAVGGTGTFSERTAAAVSTTGQTHDGIVTRTVATDTERASVLPSLSGTRVLVERQVTNVEALDAAAARMHDSPDHVREQVSFALVEGELDMTYPPTPGDIVTVRFADILLGQSVTRLVRLMGIRMQPQRGLIGVEARVLREEQVGG